MDTLLNFEASTTLELNTETLVAEKRLHHAVNGRWNVDQAATAIRDQENRVRMVQSEVEGRATRAQYHFYDDEETTCGTAIVSVNQGSLHVSARGRTPKVAQDLVSQIREMFPIDVREDDDAVPVTFWTYSPHGARSLRRDLDAQSWEAIAPNYAKATQPGLGDMMSEEFRPGSGGQLLLWHGPPGTGKTTALRALAREWRKWCDVHYVVDPDRLFGANADYMMDVLLQEPGMELSSPGEEPEVPVGERWRLLVLEDAGEMLRPDAMTDIGQQALARFLNACDGLIGRGLRVIVLVTTNEPMEKLHAAVARPGRCAARIEFEEFTLAEAETWLEERDIPDDMEVPESRTLADLFAVVEGFNDPALKKATVGFTS